jgi:hypothetical protein
MHHSFYSRAQQRLRLLRPRAPLALSGARFVAHPFLKEQGHNGVPQNQHAIMGNYSELAFIDHR